MQWLWTLLIPMSIHLPCFFVTCFHPSLLTDCPFPCSDCDGCEHFCFPLPALFLCYMFSSFIPYRLSLPVQRLWRLWTLLLPPSLPRSLVTCSHPSFLTDCPFPCSGCDGCEHYCFPHPCPVPLLHVLILHSLQTVPSRAAAMTAVNITASPIPVPFPCYMFSSFIPYRLPLPVQWLWWVWTLLLSTPLSCFFVTCVHPSLLTDCPFPCSDCE